MCCDVMSDARCVLRIVRLSRVLRLLRQAKGKSTTTAIFQSWRKGIEVLTKLLLAGGAGHYYKSHVRKNRNCFSIAVVFFFLKQKI